MIGWEKDHIENERSLADIKYVYSFFIVYNIVSTNTNKTSVYLEFPQNVILKRI